jgi:hypothetical protein
VSKVSPAEIPDAPAPIITTCVSISTSVWYLSKLFPDCLPLKTMKGAREVGKGEVLQISVKETREKRSSRKQGQAAQKQWFFVTNSLFEEMLWRSLRVNKTKRQDKNKNKNKNRNRNKKNKNKNEQQDQDQNQDQDQQDQDK